MKIQFVAATAAIALFAGTPAMAIDPAFDPVLSTSNSNENTTPSPNLPLQSRPGAVPSGERAGNSGEGMPPHSAGLAPTYYAPPSSAPAYYTQPVYYTQPTTYYVPPVATYTPPVVTYTTPSVAVGPGTSINGLIGSQVSDMHGIRVGQVTDVVIVPNRAPLAVVGLGQMPGTVERTIALPLDHMHHSTSGGLAFAATSDQIWSMPIYYR